MRLSRVLLFLVCICQMQVSAQKNLSLVCVGTSITYGIGSGDGNGYRKMLFEKLLAQGYHVKMLGSQHNGTFVQPSCEGYPGKTITFFQDSVVSRIASLPADFILLEVGANDMSFPVDPEHAGFRLSSLLDKIAAALPNAHILLASISPIWTNRALAYNKDLPGIVNIKRAQGMKISLCDMYGSGIGINEVPDAFHPNDAGYAKMAQVWLDAIVSVQKGSLLPSAASNVSVTPGPGQCVVRWTSTFNASSFKINRATSAHGPFKEIGRTNSSFWWVDTTAINDQTFYYQVIATNEQGDANVSKVVSATPNATLTIAINCGGPKTAGFQGDFGFEGGQPSNWYWDKVNLKSVVHQNTIFVYKTGREGNFLYKLQDLSPAKYYHLKLHFMEGQYTQPGKRIFHVEINGVKKLFNYDIFEKTRAKNMAHTESFYLKPDAQGNLIVKFISVVNDAHLSGIELGD